MNDSQTYFIPSNIPTGYPSNLLFGAREVGTSVQPRFLFPGNSDSVAVVTPGISFRMPETGLLRSLRVRQNIGGNPGNRDLTYTVRLDGVDTPLAVTMAANAADGADLVNIVPVLANQRVSLRVTKTGPLNTSPMDIIAAMVFST